MKPIQAYAPYAPVLIAAAVFFVFALVLWLTGRRALASSRGGLDWIRDYRTEGYDLSKDRLTCYSRDKLALFAVVVFSLIFSAATAFLRSHYETGSWFAGFYSAKTLCKLLIYAGGAFAVCWLLQDIFCDDTLAVCGGILFAASFVGGHTAMSLLAGSLLLLLRWFTADDDAPLFPQILLLFAADVLLAMAASRMISLTWIAVFYLALHIYKSVRRAAADYGRKWEIIVLPLAGILLWLLAFVVTGISVAILSGWISLSTLGSVTAPGLLLRMLLRPLKVPAMLVTAELNRGLLLYPLCDAPLLMLGFFGFFVCLRTAIDRHEPYALLSGLLLLALGLTWVLTRQYCLLPGLLLCSVSLLRRFTAAEKKAPVIAYTALSCIYYFMLYVLTYLYAVSPDLALIVA